jgi:ketosteroid isomerase-like protein
MNNTADVTLSDPLTTIRSLVDATNAHDLERLVGLFAADYALEAPLHPARSFRGNGQVRENWRQIFAGVPDIRARLTGTAVAGVEVWSEWEMSGTRRDGAAHLMRGVFIFTVDSGRIVRGRMFLESVDAASTDMTAAVKAAVRPKS